MKQKITLLFFITGLCLNFSCSPYKDIPYYQNLDHTKQTEEDITNFKPLIIQEGDILGINVSALNPEAASVFNEGLNRVNGNNMENIPGNPVYGYKVLHSGEVSLPLIGDVKVAGLTTDGLEEELRSQLMPFLKKPIVNVRILNFKITVNGDVAKPDVYTVQNDHININEALGLAGDLTITAKRKNVILIREINGKRQYIPIDLTKKDFITSNYYYLRNNDIIYVEPDRTKYAPFDRGYRTTSLIITGLSVVAVLLSAILIQHR